MSTPDRLVWIDCEMTGLDPKKDALVEIAAIVTDGELNILGDGVSVVIRPPAKALKAMGDFVRDMHATSGLLPELEHGMSMRDAEKLVLDYVKEHTAEGKAPLAGNTVGMDRLFIDRDMPALSSWLHYRVVDVSSIKELARRWYPRAYFASPEKTGGHRALGDIQDSIRELRYYRETVFVAAPGPETDVARRVAEAVTSAPESKA